MSSLPSLPGRAVVTAFERAGFVLIRITASHHILKKDGHPYLLSVPIHGSTPLKRGTLRSLIRASGMSVEVFREYAE
jgi:predicted RNA binding protein YcfA (HicA-like mRNA interferase family)